MPYANDVVMFSIFHHIVAAKGNGKSVYQPLLPEQLMLGVTGSLFHFLLLQQLIADTCLKRQKKQNSDEILKFQGNQTSKKCTKQLKNVLND